MLERADCGSTCIQSPAECQSCPSNPRRRSTVRRGSDAGGCSSLSPALLPFTRNPLSGGSDYSGEMANPHAARIPRMPVEAATISKQLCQKRLFKNFLHCGNPVEKLWKPVEN